MKLPTIWISPDAFFLVALDKVTSVSPGVNGGITVRSGGGSVGLNEANGKDFVAALLRFHLHGFPPAKTNPTTEKSDHDL